ncbi:MAG: hypothetical protein V4529_16630 [Gemmatimonadota bacterium]
MNPIETEALAVLRALAPFMPHRVGPMIPKLVDLAQMVLSGDPIPADYLKGLLELGEADLQGQAAAKWG